MRGSGSAGPGEGGLGGGGEGGGGGGGQGGGGGEGGCLFRGGHHCGGGPASYQGASGERRVANFAIGARLSIMYHLIRRSGGGHCRGSGCLTRGQGVLTARVTGPTLAVKLEDQTEPGSIFLRSGDGRYDQVQLRV